MKKQLLFRSVIPAGIPLLAFALFAACGDEVTQINQTGLEVIASVDDLPKCTKDNEGVQLLVKTDGAMRVCFDGEWKSLSLDGSASSGYSCKTEELKDKSGLKIICNGDSIGVVLNGEKGEAGKNGKDGEDGSDGKAGSGCTMTDKTDSTITVVCGDSTMVIELGVGSDAAEPDSERTPISLDSLVGFTQKGPFLKGSTVYLYELSDGRTLKQTNGNFTSKISSDNGRYKFSARDLVSQYAMVVVDGYYRNEVTGAASDAPIRLTALTDMRKRSSVNVNLLTHMEFDRVYNLVTRGDSTGKKLTVKHAKRQAQREILKQFHIVLNDSTDAEDMDVFGSTDADAALLAVSILLQGDSNSSALSVLLTEISNDIAAYGEWRGSDAKTRIADWALAADTAGTSLFDVFRVNVENWGLSETVPGFEKHLRNFIAEENHLGVCGSSSVPIGTVKHVSNSKSAYYAKKYEGIDKDDSKIRFICKDENGARWIPATNIEKDTVGFGHAYKEGAIRKGVIDTNLTYVYENENWRHGTDLDDVVGLGCALSRKDTVALGKDGVWYKCKKDTNVSYLSADNSIESEWSTVWRAATELEMDTYESLKECKADGIYGDGTLLNGRINDMRQYVCDNGEFRYATAQEIGMGKGCVSYIDGKNYPFGKMKYYYTCKLNEGWNLDRDNWVTDPRDGTTYRTVTIGSQVIMAENLSYEYKVFNPYSGDTVVYGNMCYSKLGEDVVMDSCRTRGRYYTWGAAMDSAAVFSEGGKGCTINYSECKRTFPVRGICPEGWHIPDSTEWAALYEFVGNDVSRLMAEGFDSDYWRNATDEFGLSLRPAGWFYNYSFDNGGFAYLWTSSMNHTDDFETYYRSFAYVPYLINVSRTIRFSAIRSSKSNNGEGNDLQKERNRAVSVRCFKD